MATPNLIIITGDRIAADIVGLGVIRSFGGWQRLKTMNIWEQRQIKRAIELHLGVSNPSALEMVSKCLGADKSGFDELMQNIHNNLNIQK